MADERLMTIIFSGSEGRLLDVFFEESAVSRMIVYEPSPDIPLDEAVAYILGSVGVLTEPRMQLKW